MGLVRDWRRQAARATGISLIAPVVLLVSATFVAASGGGFGGIESLGQVAAGPPLPETGVAAVPQRSPGERELAAVVEPPAPPPPSTAPPADTNASTAPPPVAPPISVDLPPSAADDPDAVAFTPPSSSAPADKPLPDTAGVPESVPPPGAPAVPPPADPVRDLIDRTRDLTRGLPIVGQPTDDILKILVGP